MSDSLLSAMDRAIEWVIINGTDASPTKAYLESEGTAGDAADLIARQVLIDMAINPAKYEPLTIPRGDN